MSFKIEGSAETYSDELSLFHLPPTNVTYEKVQWIDYSPSTPLTDGGSIDFIIPSSGAQYIDLKRTLLNVKFKILKKDGTNIDLQDKVAPINLTLHSLFKDVQLFMQQRLVTSSQENYAYKAYLETVLDYGKEAKQSWLQCQGYYKDTAGSMDETNPLTGGNSGLGERFGRVVPPLGNHVCDLEGPLMLDLCQQAKPLINGIDLQFRLFPSDKTFVLTAEEEGYRLVITDMVMKVCKLTPSPSVIVSHAEMINYTPAKYPYMKTDIKTFTFTPGRYSIAVTDVFQGKIPSTLIIALVASEAYRGSYKRNPFNFFHYFTNSIKVSVDDMPIRGNPLLTNFEENQGGNFVDAFQSLFSSVNALSRNVGNDIQLKDFGQGYSIFAFDLIHVEPNQLPLIKNGNLKVEIGFKKQLTEGVTAILYGKFPSLLEITEARTINL